MIDNFHRWLNNSFLIATNLSISFLCALLIYSLFYTFYIPTLHHDFPIDFKYDYGMTTHKFPVAYAVADLSNMKFKQFLALSQSYDVKLFIHLPESRHNLDLGNFMLQVSLLHLEDPAGRPNLSVNVNNEDEFYEYALNGTEIFKASKSVLLEYKSFWPRELLRWLRMFFLISGFSSESQLVAIPMISDLRDDKVSC
jgi:hypothetical protein